MKIVNIIICLACLMLTACGNTKINVEYSSPIHSYSYDLPYEGGYLLAGEKKAKILLKFYRPNKLFSLDTDERLHIYIVYDGKDIRAFNPEKIKAFIIRVQTDPYWSYMKINKFRLVEVDDKIVISGKFITGKTYPRETNVAKLNVSFEHLVLSHLDSFDELQKQSYDFYKDRLKELFYDEWYH